MYKYEGLLVYQSHDDEGIIEIVETTGIRSLHFGTSARQSSMIINHPDCLHSMYARAMMSWLLFKDDPGEVLMIGLGGGSLAKYLLHRFEDCKIKAIEYRPSVVKIARSHFCLPLDPRLKIIIGDGGHFIRQHSLTRNGQYGLLMIDAFDHKGMANSVSGEAFFDGCKALLKDNGILAINLWGTDKALFQQVSWQLGRIFDWRVLFLPVRGRGNIIGFAFNPGIAKVSMKSLRTRAELLQQRFELEFTYFVHDLKRNNTSLFSRVVTS